MSRELDVSTIVNLIERCKQNIESKYSAECLPPKMTDPSTEKASSCLFEEINNEIYVNQARMVAFRTNQDRFQSWIKAFYMFYMQQGESESTCSKYKVEWNDHPTPISKQQPLQKITIDVKNERSEKLYKVTLFSKSGLIQVQGNCHQDFAKNVFPTLQKFMKQITLDSGLLDNEQTFTKEVFSEIQEVLLQDDCAIVHDLTNTPENAPDAQPQDKNNNFVSLIDLQRIELAFSKSFAKLYNACTLNTDKIIDTLNQTILKINDKGDKTSIEDPACIRKLKVENSQLEMQLQIAKTNATLEKEQLESLLATEKKMLHDTREQMLTAMSNFQKEEEILGRKLKEKNEEVDKLTLTIKDLNFQLDHARDQIIQLKMQITDPKQETQFNSAGAKNPNSELHMPTVLLVGTSNVKGIKEDKVTSAAIVTKEVKYTMDETMDFINSVVSPPDILILHSLTNDVKHTSPQDCVNKMFRITSSICYKWPLIKIILSLTTPRCDNMNNSANAQIVNVLMKQRFSGVDNIYILDHSNMLAQGNPNKLLLCDDGIHLNDRGLASLAMNFKRGIHSALAIPPPTSRPRSRSRGPHRGRGRGNTHQY